MHIAIIGTRGVPANYGGFETFAEELGARLVERDHKVSVYCRTSSYHGPWEDAYRGMRRVRIWAPKRKHLETVVSSAVALVHATLVLRPDVILLVNAINAWLSFLPRVCRIPVILNVDGIEKQRSKWGYAGRTAYRASEYFVTRLPSCFVSDADVIRDHYYDRFRADSPVIRYGAVLIERTSAGQLAEFGLETNRYMLYVSRLEPENGALDVIDAFSTARGVKWPLVIVGDAPYASNYKKRVAAAAVSDERIRFLGSVYGYRYDHLRGGAGLYIQATQVGGTHPALLEAMAAGNAVVARNTPEHYEVLGDAGVYFDTVDELSAHIDRLTVNDDERKALGAAARKRISEQFSWDSVVVAYERLCETLINGRRYNGTDTRL